MDKKEPNFNMWGEISHSELVLDAAKVQQKNKKTARKISLRAAGGGRLVTTSCRCRSEKHSEKHEVGDKDNS